MQTLRNFVAVVLGVVVFLFASWLLPQKSVDAVAKKEAARSFYLTTTTHTGDQALTACAPGFHMASLWEILDPSNLQYETTLGFTASDSGSGPPAAGFTDSGWVRTGFGREGTGHIGQVNCEAWSSGADDVFGTVVWLEGKWRESLVVKSIAPWSAEGLECASGVRVWCVED